MTAHYPPFMFAYSCIGDVFSKIREHDVPDIFTHDFLRFTLGFSRESDRAFIPLAKRTGLLTSEGKPTDLYLRLRDPSQVAAVLGIAMKQGYPMFYAKHPDAHTLDRKALAAMVAEVTGMEHGHASARAIVGTFFALNKLASPPVDEPAENRRKAAERRKRW